MKCACSWLECFCDRQLFIHIDFIFVCIYPMQILELVLENFIYPWYRWVSPFLIKKLINGKSPILSEH